MDCPSVDLSSEPYTRHKDPIDLLRIRILNIEISKVPAFQDQATGQFDRTKVLGYLKQIDQDPTGEARTRWVGFQKYLIGLIKTSKYNSLVSNAMYVTGEEAIQHSLFYVVAYASDSVGECYSRHCSLLTGSTSTLQWAELAQLSLCCC